MSFPLVVSYFTAGTPYADEALHLIRSLKRFDLEHEIVAIEPSSSWVRNCAMKGGFMRDAMQRHQRPLLWIDVDLRVLKRPVLFEDMACDVAALRASDDSSLCSALVYVDHSPHALSLLELWAEMCVKEPEVFDQAHLHDVVKYMEAHFRGFRFTGLPHGYCIKETETIRKGDPPERVIQHYMASRRFKHEV